MSFVVSDIYNWYRLRGFNCFRTPIRRHKLSRHGARTLRQKLRVYYTSRGTGRGEKKLKARRSRDFKFLKGEARGRRRGQKPRRSRGFWPSRDQARSPKPRPVPMKCIRENTLA